MKGKIEINHREQYDEKREIQIIRVDNNLGTFWTVVLYNPTTQKYNYSDVSFRVLKDAHKAFCKCIEIKPITRGRKLYKKH